MAHYSELWAESQFEKATDLVFYLNILMRFGVSSRVFLRAGFMDGRLAGL